MKKAYLITAFSIFVFTAAGILANSKINSKHQIFIVEMKKNLSIDGCDFCHNSTTGIKQEEGLQQYWLEGQKNFAKTGSISPCNTCHGFNGAIKK